MTQPPGRSAGFTLIEMLLALVVFALIGAGLYGGLRFGARAWDAGTGAMDQLAAETAALDFLSSRLAATRVLIARTADGRLDPAFRGEADRLRFASPFPAHLGLGGLYRFELFLDTEREALMLDWRLDRPGGPIDVAQGRDRPRVLIAPVTAVSLRYLGAEPAARGLANAEAVWQQDWTERPRLPLAIELTVRSPDGTERRLAVRPVAAL